jgi:hypothetical protein
LFVAAAAASVQDRVLFIGVTFVGAGLCLLVWLTVIRAYVKLDILLKVLYRAFPDHPIAIADQRPDDGTVKIRRAFAAAEAQSRLWRLNLVRET